MVTLTGPKDVATTTSSPWRCIVLASTAGHGSMWLVTCRTGNRERIMLPNNCRSPFDDVISTAGLKIGV